MGDFNARHPHWGDKASNEYGSQLFDNLDFSMFSIISSGGPTFLSTNGQSCIDFAIASNNLLKKKIGCTTDAYANLFSGAPYRRHLPVILDLYSYQQHHVTIKKKIDYQVFHVKCRQLKLTWHANGA